jgi:hypothetical protein
MATLTQSQVYTIAIVSGLPNPKVMAAVAMAESSGRTDVVNSIGCVGLWQINQPVHVKSHPTWTKEWLKNPLNNATAAKAIYKSQGLRAWEAYTNGAYAKYLGNTVKQEASSVSEVEQATWWDPLDILPHGDDPGLVGGVTGIDLSALSGIAEGTLGLAESAQKTAFWLAQPHNWLRIAYVSIGGFVAIAAVVSIASKTSAGHQVTTAAGKVAGGAVSVLPGGGTLKGAGKALGAKTKSASKALGTKVKKKVAK